MVAVAERKSKTGKQQRAADPDAQLLNRCRTMLTKVDITDDDRVFLEMVDGDGRFFNGAHRERAEKLVALHFDQQAEHPDAKLLAQLGSLADVSKSDQRTLKPLLAMSPPLSESARTQARRLLDVYGSGSPPAALEELDGKQLLDRLASMRSRRYEDLRQRDRDRIAELIAAGQPLHGDDRAYAELMLRESYDDADPIHGRLFPGRNGQHQANGHAVEKASQGDLWSDTFEVELDRLDRHPENRIPTDVSIAARAASMTKFGQQEDLRIRLLPKGRFQILSGETRFRAAKSLGWKKLKARSIECDDLRARLLLVEFNGQREDLDPIQKAKHILDLSTPIDQGGNGLTREEAGERVGIKSIGGASNLVRLLELPKVWQDRVASGELPQSFARMMLPVKDIPEALKAFEADWKRHEQDDYSCFSSREAVEREVAHQLRMRTRGFDTWSPQVYDSAIGYGPHPVCISAEDIEKHRKQLGIITVTIDEGDGSKQVERATNIKLFDKLQAPALKAKLAEKATKRAKTAGKKADAPEKPAKTKAEIEAGKRERARQLEFALADWRENVIRKELAAAISSADVRKPHPHLLALALSLWFDGEDGGQLRDRVDEWIGDRSNRQLDTYAAVVGLVGGVTNTPLAKLQAVAQKAVAFLVEKRLALSPETLDDLCFTWEVKLEDAWRRLFTAKDPAIEEFFEHHRKGELVPLAKELGVFLEEGWGKPQMIKQLLGRTAPLPLPKCLQPEVKRTKSKKK
jgi:ParB/RepB/Spo0J family partition protein